MSDAKSLLKEAIDRLEHYAKRQGRVRMGAREMGGDGIKHQTFINPNPAQGQHYPAVQSFIDRAKAEIKHLST